MGSGPLRAAEAPSVIRRTQRLGIAMSETDANDVSAEFQLRRAATWRGIRAWVGVVAVAVAAGALVGDLGSNDPLSTWIPGLVAFAAIMFAMFRIIRIAGNSYRCPSCGEVPMSWSGMLGPGSIGARKMVELNPDTCGNCGARLRAQ